MSLYRGYFAISNLDPTGSEQENTYCHDHCRRKVKYVDEDNPIFRRCLRECFEKNPDGYPGPTVGLMPPPPNPLTCAPGFYIRCGVVYDKVAKIIRVACTCAKLAPSTGGGATGSSTGAGTGKCKKSCKEKGLVECDEEHFESGGAKSDCNYCNYGGPCQPGKHVLLDSPNFIPGSIHQSCKWSDDGIHADSFFKGMCCVNTENGGELVVRSRCAPSSGTN